MRWLCLWITVFTSLLTPSVGVADEQDILKDVVRYDGNLFFYPSTPNTLYLIGGIGEFDTFEQYSRASVEFRRAIRNHSVEKLVLASGGGTVDVGLNYASIINDKGLSVYVPKSVGCFSACSFMFFGGQKKTAAGPVGVHQFYSMSEKLEKKQVAQQSTQYGVADIIAILNSFEVPPRIYEHMFSRVGNDFYNLSEADLNDLGVASREDWHSRADSVIDALSKNNSAIKDLIAFVEGDQPIERDALAIDKTEDSKQPSRDEIVKLAFIEVQKLLNQHNCNAGVPDGVVGPKTEAAFERFVTATGVTIDFDSNNAFEQVINALEKTKRPACGQMQGLDQPATPQSSDPRLLDKSLLGDWAILQRCNIGSSSRILRGQLTLTNLTVKSGTTPTAAYDAYYVTQNGDEFSGTVTEMLWRNDKEIYVNLSRSSNSSDKIVVYGSDINADRSAITVKHSSFEQGTPNGNCTIDAYRVRYDNTSKSLHKTTPKNIKINVDGPTWIKIEDADGNLLYNKYAYRYLPAEVRGKPPLIIYVVRADKVTSIQVNGQEFGNVRIRNNVLSATVR
jgi:peptidoglycan hydrolase-like protein with peptidoglycan-binding domain